MPRVINSCVPFFLTLHYNLKYCNSINFHAHTHTNTHTHTHAHTHTHTHTEPRKDPPCSLPVTTYMKSSLSSLWIIIILTCDRIHHYYYAIIYYTVLAHVVVYWYLLCCAPLLHAARNNGDVAETVRPIVVLVRINKN